MGIDENGNIYINYEDMTLPRDVGGFRFVPTVSSTLDMVTDITITLLRPELPGRILTQGGDLDNRLKTLLDALKVPTKDEIPSGAAPAQDENPFFCLVEDDALMTGLDVRTDRLLGPPDGDPAEALLSLRVRTKLVAGNMANLGLV